MDRLAKFNEICKAEGIRLAAENLCSGNPPLFNEEQFLEIFRRIPDLNCCIDVGHALATGMDITRLQKTLGSRICAYHLHNNDGTRDAHNRLREGCMGWNQFAENAKLYTPDATGIIEYLIEDRAEACVEDIRYLAAL